MQPLNGKKAQIPQEAFRMVQCKCGSIYFDTVQRVRMYRAGVWSKDTVIQPIVTLVCLGCMAPFDEKEVDLIENPKPPIVE